MNTCGTCLCNVIVTGIQAGEEVCVVCGVCPYVCMYVSMCVCVCVCVRVYVYLNVCGCGVGVFMCMYMCVCVW